MHLCTGTQVRGKMLIMDELKKKKEKIRISVRNLVEFILRSGDLDNRRTASQDRDAMQKGSRIHRKIQKQMGIGYQAEVPLTWEEEYESFIICLEGRADGILTEGENVTIDEIKGVYLDLDYLQEPIPVHKAQAMCYACIYGRQIHAETIAVRMTYCHLESEQIRRFTEELSMAWLNQWFEDLLAQ